MDDQNETTEPCEVADDGEATEAPAEEPITESLEEELARLRAELAAANDKYLRAAADFDNSRKRLRAEHAQRSQYAIEALVTDLLPVLDSLERALLMDSSADATLRSGVELTARMLAEALTRYGVRPIVAVGQPFDPTKHEAITQVESADHDEGTVVEELQRGYLLRDRVIRPSMVKVAAASANANGQEVEP